jgi:hypothetical protein
MVSEACSGYSTLIQSQCSVPEIVSDRENFDNVVRSASSARLFSLNSEVEKSSFVLIVVLVIENPFHALVRNSSCNGLLTQQVIVRVSGDCPASDLR